VASSRGSSSTRTGEARIRRTLDDNDDPVLAYRPVKGGDWKPLPKSIAGRQLYGTVWEQDNNVLYAFVADAMEAAQAYRIDLAAGTRTKLDDQSDITPDGWFPRRTQRRTLRRLLQQQTSPAENHQAGVGVRKAVHRHPESLPRARWCTSAISVATTTVCCSRWPPTRMPATGTSYDRAEKKAQKLVEYRPWLKPETWRSLARSASPRAMAPRSTGSTRPTARARSPTIVMPHGGPYNVAE
jgi:hypothetical protein